MMFRAAIALLALAAPAFAQRSGAHAGSSGNRGFAAHSGFSESPGFSRSGSFVRSAPPVSYGDFAGARFRAIQPPNYASHPIPAYGNRFMAARPAYGSMGAGPSRAWNRDEDRDHRDRFDARRRSFQNWYSNFYPAWPGYGYPYAIDPGFYDLDDSEDSAYSQGAAAPGYPAQYPDQGDGAPGENPQEAFPPEFPPTSEQDRQPTAAFSGAPSAPVPEQPLMVVFKGGRAPVKMQNYMMTAKVLTDLDSQHYEQIPIDQIDVAATQRINSAAGVGFEIPGASRD